MNIRSQLFQIELNFDERQAAGIALNRQLAQQCAVREFLVVVGVEKLPSRGSQMFFDRAVVRKHAQHRQKVHAMPNQARVVKQSLSRGRDADHQLGLAREPVQQNLKTREQRDIQSATQPGACFLQLSG